MGIGRESAEAKLDIYYFQREIGTQVVSTRSLTLVEKHQWELETHTLLPFSRRDLHTAKRAYIAPMWNGNKHNSNGGIWVALKAGRQPPREQLWKLLVLWLSRARKCKVLHLEITWLVSFLENSWLGVCCGVCRNRWAKSETCSMVILPLEL